MPIPIDHTFFWPPKVYSADERLREDEAIGVHGDPPPYLRPGTFFVYFSRSDDGPSGGIYNLTAEQARIVVDRLSKDRQAPFKALIDGMDGVGFAHRNEEISYV